MFASAAAHIWRYGDVELWKHECGEVARTDQNLRYASLEERRTLTALSTDGRRDTETLNELCTHRATHRV